MGIDVEDAISVVVTAYNCALYLGQAIESVLSQTLAPQQIIVVDDGSTDACAQVVRAYGDRVQYHYQPNSGSGSARNAGIRLAASHWLALLDGDDYWEPNKLEVQMTAALADSAVDVLFSHIRQFASPDLDPDRRARLHVPSEPMPGQHPSTMLIRRQAFWRVGEFVTNLHISEFLDWYGRATEAGLRERLLPDTLAWRRIHANNSTRRNLDHRPDYARVLKALLDRRRLSNRFDGPA